MQPLLFRVYGIGDRDFRLIRAEHLAAIDEEAAVRGYAVLPAVPLTAASLDRVTEVLGAYASASADGRLEAVAGFSGYLGPRPLGRGEWARVAGLAPLGLRTIRLDVAAWGLDDEAAAGLRVRDLLNALDEAGVAIELTASDTAAPSLAAERLAAVAQHLATRHRRVGHGVFLADLPFPARKAVVEAVLTAATRYGAMLCLPFEPASAARDAAAARSVRRGAAIAVTGHTELPSTPQAEEVCPLPDVRQAGLTPLLRTLRLQAFTESEVEDLTGENSWALLKAHRRT
ncbi:hypothetical protein ACWGKQ_08275 [Streptomyces sp. NPDC054770]